MLLSNTLDLLRALVLAENNALLVPGKPRIWVQQQCLLDRRERVVESAKAAMGKPGVIPGRKIVRREAPSVFQRHNRLGQALYVEQRLPKATPGLPGLWPKHDALIEQRQGVSRPILVHQLVTLLQQLAVSIRCSLPKWHRASFSADAISTPDSRLCKSVLRLARLFRSDRRQFCGRNRGHAANPNRRTRLPRSIV